MLTMDQNHAGKAKLRIITDICVIQIANIIIVREATTMSNDGLIVCLMPFSYWTKFLVVDGILLHFYIKQDILHFIM